MNTKFCDYLNQNKYPQIQYSIEKLFIRSILQVLGIAISQLNQRKFIMIKQDQMFQLSHRILLYLLQY